MQTAKPKPEEGGIDRKAVAAAALAAAKSAASVSAGQQHGMVTVTETRRFAGQNISVTREVAADSKEAKKLGEPSQQDAAAKKQAGLDAVLASMAAAKKVTVLDKSQADWRQFKKTDDNVDQELEVHKRSGAAYLDRQAFLKKVELAEYEKERDQRLASDVRNRGRL
jgi:hypothetical protein